jgi:hypothetical protein
LITLGSSLEDHVTGVTLDDSSIASEHAALPPQPSVCWFHTVPSPVPVFTSSSSFPEPKCVSPPGALIWEPCSPGVLGSTSLLHCLLAGVGLPRACPPHPARPPASSEGAAPSRWACSGRCASPHGGRCRGGAAPPPPGPGAAAPGAAGTPPTRWRGLSSGKD